MAAFQNGQEWKAPPFYGFKPFFTLQPVAATREKQLKLWRDLIVDYHRSMRRYRMADPTKFELFRNQDIDRQLNLEGIKSVIASLIESGLAEWEDQSANEEDNSGALLIMFKRSETLASEIYEWATNENLIGNVATIYEMTADEDEHGSESPFKGTELPVLKKALAVLQAGGKCVVIEGASPEEDGVKFL